MTDSPTLGQLADYIRVLAVRCSTCGYEASEPMPDLVRAYGRDAPVRVAWRGRAQECPNRSAGCTLHAPQIAELKLNG